MRAGERPETAAGAAAALPRGAGGGAFRGGLPSRARPVSTSRHCCSFRCSCWRRAGSLRSPAAAGLFGAGLVLLARPPVGCLRHARSAPAAIFAVAAGLGSVSAAWSPDPLRSLDQAARLAGLFVAALAMAAAAGHVSAPRRLASFLLAGFVVALVMATVDLATYGALSKPFSDRVYQPAWLNQASVAFAILLLPTSAAVIAAGARLPGLLLAGRRRRDDLSSSPEPRQRRRSPPGCRLRSFAGAGVPAVAWAAAVLSVLVVVTAPLTFARLDRVSGVVHTADEVKLSAGHRLLIWSFVGDRIAEHPLRGWGLDSSRAIPGGRDPIRPDETWLPLHPHNAPLQLWLELGVPGAVLFALLSGLALARSRPRRLAAALRRGCRRQSRHRLCRVGRHLRHLAGMVARHLVVLAVHGLW